MKRGDPSNFSQQRCFQIKHRSTKCSVTLQPSANRYLKTLRAIAYIVKIHGVTGAGSIKKSARK